MYDVFFLPYLIAYTPLTLKEVIEGGELDHTALCVALA